jgi:glycosyltransferase involved in cell wall biosynthesis
MKVYLPIQLDPLNGKYLFIGRLAKAMSNLGISVTSNVKAKVDVSLHIRVVWHPIKSKKKVIRLANALKGTYGSMRNPKRRGLIDLHQADGIVYQSKFGKRICERFMGKHRGPTAIINNGADLSFYDGIKPAKSKYNYNFLACARWPSRKGKKWVVRGSKRLPDTIKSFLLADIDDSHLWVAGDLSKCKGEVAKYRKFKNISFLGYLTPKRLGAYYKLCDATIHLSWLDACPNSIVEAICAGCLPITNNVGGTHELVRPSGGIVCDIDKPYNYRPTTSLKPPKIDRTIVAKALRIASRREHIIDRHYLDINKIAKQYAQFFKELLV